MAWDGNGGFTRTNGTQTGSTTWANARDAGNNITASQHDTHDQDLADGIAACLTKNNETKPTADFRPNADNTYDLGSSALRWVELYLSSFIRGATEIRDGNGNELLKFTATASAVNEFTLANAATGNAVSLSATGGDTNIGITLTPKGTGAVTVSGPLSVTGNATLGDGAGDTHTLNGTVSIPTGNASVSRSNAGGDVVASITNTDNTNAASHAAVEIFGGGASGGDAKVRCAITGVGSFSHGYDRSAGKWVLSHGTALGTNDIIRSDTSGNVEIPTTLQWGTGDAQRGTKIARKTADESVTSSTTLQDDNHLTFTIAANEEWVAEFTLYIGNDVGATTGFKVAITTPAAATLIASATVFGSGVVSGSSITSGTAISTFTAGAFTGGSTETRVTVRVANGANAGSITLQWAQGTSSATALTVKTGSYVIAHRIA